MHVLEHIRKMTPERFLAIYTALESKGYGPLDGEVAKSLHFRPLAIKKLPMAQRARRARILLEGSRNAELAYELVGTYLMKTCKEMVTAFLDATGVKHEDGMIEDTEKSIPAGDKVAPAVHELDERYPPDDVTLYLVICSQQWPKVKELEQLLASRP